MTPSVLTISDTSTVQQAALLMAQKGIGVLPVTDDKGSKMTGMLTDRDITVRACAAGMDPRSTLVESIKTSETPRYVFEDEVGTTAADSCFSEVSRVYTFAQALPHLPLCLPSPCEPCPARTTAANRSRGAQHGGGAGAAPARDVPGQAPGGHRGAVRHHVPPAAARQGRGGGRGAGGHRAASGAPPELS